MYIEYLMLDLNQNLLGRVLTMTYFYIQILNCSFSILGCYSEGRIDVNQKETSCEMLCKI